MHDNAKYTEKLKICKSKFNIILNPVILIRITMLPSTYVAWRDWYSNCAWPYEPYSYNCSLLISYNSEFFNYLNLLSDLRMEL